MKREEKGKRRRKEEEGKGREDRGEVGEERKIDDWKSIV